MTLVILMTSEDRALANGLFIFAATLTVGAIMIIVMDPFMSDIFPEIQGQCVTSACTTGEGWVNDAWTYFGWFALLLAVLMFIRAASVESRRAP